MRRFLSALALITAWQGHALASGDDSCSPTWSLDSSSYNGCSNLPFLTPSNDSWVNLALMRTKQTPLTFTGRQLDDGSVSAGYGVVPFWVTNFKLGDQGIAALAEPVPENPPPSPDRPAWAELSKKLDLGLDPEFPDSLKDLGLAGLSYGESSRCQSNSPATALRFVHELDHDAGLTAPARKALALARIALLKSCTPTAKQTTALLPQGLEGPLAAAYHDYLAASAAFYRGDFTAAKQQFTALTTAGAPWVAETARYMVARTALNQAQDGLFDEWGSRQADKFNKAAADEAEQSLDAYLKAYPQGLYAASASGLKRKIYWLAGDQPRLLAAYTDLFSHPPAGTDWTAVMNEIDGKYVGSDPTPYGVDHQPLPAHPKGFTVAEAEMMAMLDLIWMRPEWQERENKPYLGLSDLDTQKPLLDLVPGLATYLQAAHFYYVEKQPGQVLKLLPDSPLPAKPDTLAFSTAMLRGLALAAGNDQKPAEQQWRQIITAVGDDSLQRPAAELGLATSLSAQGQTTAALTGDKAVKDPTIRAVLLTRQASPAVLRARATASDGPAAERALAAYVLLYKDLINGHYGDYRSDLAAVGIDRLTGEPQPFIGLPYETIDFKRFALPLNEEGYSCPDLPAISAKLATNPKDAQGLICLGEFVRLNELDGTGLNTPPPKRVLGGGDSEFTGPLFSRLEGYKLIIADAKAGKTDKAYALYRAVMCYSPSGVNSCGGVDVEQDQRKAWFRTLKSRYGDTSWAKGLKYYW